MVGCPRPAAWVVGFLSLSASAAPFELEVVDARTGKPLADAQVTVVGLEVDRGQVDSTCPDGLLPPSKQARLSAPGGPRVERRTGKDGRASFSESELAALKPPERHCPPGAPCVPPPELAALTEVAAPRHVSIRLGPEWERGRLVPGQGRVALVPIGAAASSPEAAVAAVEALPRWKGWVGRLGYKAPRVCLSREGQWRVIAEGVSGPTVLPRVEARVEAVSGTARLWSCPVQGSHLRVTRVGKDGVDVEDEATGFSFACAAPQGASCESVALGGTLAVTSYGAGWDKGCADVLKGELTLELGACALPQCRRTR